MSDSVTPWNSPGQNTRVGSLPLLQGVFSTQGLNPGLPHCRWILYQLSHKGSPRILEWVAYLFFSGSSWPRNQTGVSCIAGGFFTNWAMTEALTVIINKLKSHAPTQIRIKNMIRVIESQLQNHTYYSIHTRIFDFRNIKEYIGMIKTQWLKLRNGCLWEGKKNKNVKDYMGNFNYIWNIYSSKNRKNITYTWKMLG